MSGFLLGYDIGSSSVKASLLNSQTGELITSATSPDKELKIIANQPGWAEQEPETWWEHIQKATHMIKEKNKAELNDVDAIGISYQMHGLVLVDKDQNVLRPSIIWCDSRAAEIGEKAFNDIGPEKCLSNLLNSPGNFTASKLKWVKDNEPDIYNKIYKMMMPGDFIAMKLTNEIKTTPSGLSEGILWDFKKNAPADLIMDHYGFSKDFLPEVVPTFSEQGVLSTEAAELLGMKPGTKIAYRAGDQPNNALSLNVLHPGEIAATAGTSGVVYGVGDTPDHDPLSRVNTFVHVNHDEQNHRYGTLLCLNGAGILNSWAKHNFMTLKDTIIDYPEMNEIASKAEVGANGLFILPFGNGAERILGNKNIGASFHGLNFNIHNRSHVLRAVNEGIVFALNYGMEIMKGMNIKISKVRAGYANMFLSPLFSDIFATVTDAHVELYNTDGSQGAARGAGIGAKIYKNSEEAFQGLKSIKSIEPNQSLSAGYKDTYEKWKELLNKTML